MRRRTLVIALIAVPALLLLVLWLAIPAILVAVVNGRLPRDVDEGITVLALHRSSDGLAAPAIHLRLEPDRARALASEASRRWIPPGIMTHGLCATGSAHGDETRSVSWRVELDRTAITPTLAIALTPAEADALLAAHIRGLELGGLSLRVVPRIAAAELVELDPGTRGRRFRLDASGAMRIAAGVLAVEIPVKRLVLDVEIELRASVAGWEPEVRAVVSQLDAALPAIPGLDTASLKGALARAVESAADGRVLPAWFPTDLRLSAVVR